MNLIIVHGEAPGDNTFKFHSLVVCFFVVFFKSLLEGGEGLYRVSDCSLQSGRHIV